MVQQEGLGGSESRGCDGDKTEPSLKIKQRSVQLLHLNKVTREKVSVVETPLPSYILSFFISAESVSFVLQG